MKISETMYTLGQITRCIYPEGDVPDSLFGVILARPLTGLSMLMSSPGAKTVNDELGHLVARLPADISDPPGGVKIEDQGPFWLGYYQQWTLNRICCEKG